MHTTPQHVPSPSSISSANIASRPGCLTYFIFVAASLWTVGITFFIHGVGWFVDQFFLIEGIPLPWLAWPLISWGHALLLALPLVVLAIVTQWPRLKAIYQTWALATAFVFVLGLARVFPKTWTQPAALAQIILALICAGALMILALARGRRFGLQVSTLFFALSLVPIIVVPSLIWGALGSPEDTLLDLAAALSLGLFAGVLLSAFLFEPLTESSSGAGWDIGSGGFAAGVALVILGAGFGFDGSQLLLMLSLPPLGFAVAGLGRYASSPAGWDRSSTPVPTPAYAGAEGSPSHVGAISDVRGGQGVRAWLPIAALVGLSAAAPLMFVDPDELTLLLDENPFGSEIMGWAVRAAALSLVLAWAVGFVLWLFRNRISGPPRLSFSIGALAITWIGGLLIFIFAGRPGFYGEQLFVILREQADVSAAYAIPERNERLRFVYATLTQHAQKTQARLRASLDQFGIAYKPYYLVNGMEVNGGPILRAYLSMQPEVERIIDSPHLRPLPAPVPISTGHERAPSETQWNITSIGADRVWKEFNVTGKGIVVGQSDSGVQGDHPALRDGYRGRDGQHDYHWIDPWNHTRAPTDIGGHGTHTLGSILGRGGIGVAPDAEWFACVNLARNLGNPPVYLNCMQFMLAPYPQNGDPFKDGDPTLAASVINDSWGCPPLEGCDANALEPAARALRAAGVFVVASAGNEGPRCSSVSDPLAIYESVFSVGALNQHGDIAFFSSRGPVTVDGSHRIKPDILAPGVDVLSSFPGGTYAKESGTSMAGPHVAGVVALMWSAQPKLIGNIERTTQILIKTAKPYHGERPGCFEGSVPNNAFGYGVVDAYAAVKAALQEK